MSKRSRTERQAGDPKEPACEIGPYYHLDHPRPRTRRQFLAQGFLCGAAAVASPSLFGLLSKHGGGEAYAQAVDCSLVAGGAGRIPFICLDLAGGANIAGSNVMVGQSGGHENLLSLEGYSKLGLPAPMTPGVSLTPVVDLSLGLPFHFDSAFLRGILDKASLATVANVNGTIFCSRSGNDTQNNPHNPLYGIARTGSKGGLLTLVGSKATESGGNSMAPLSMIDPANRPTKVSRPEDATGLVDTGRLVEFLDAEGAESVMNAASRISGRKVDKMEITEDALVTELVRCAYEQGASLVSLYSDPTSLDPRNDPNFITGVNPILELVDFDQRRFRKMASVAKLVIDGHAGAGCVELGGYDYHNSTRTTGDQRDFEAGQCIGMSLEYAARVGSDLCLYVFSDGSVASNGELDPGANDKGIWKGDNSSTAASFMLVYRASAPPLLTDPSMQQIGYFRADGSVETSSSEVANSPEALAEAVVLNYLALHNEVGRLDEVLPTHSIGNASTLDDLIAFDKIRG